MSKRNRNKGASDGQHPKANPIHLEFDLSGPAFDGLETECTAHTAETFRPMLDDLQWHEEWAYLWNNLRARFKAAPQRPHTVYEAFVRGNRGYVPIIIMVMSPTGKEQMRGMIYSCGINVQLPEEQVIAALHELGQSACTQWLVQATGDPDYTVKWEKPL